MSQREVAELTELSETAPFVFRHIGPQPTEIASMAQSVGCSSLQELIERTVPANIAFKGRLDMPDAVDERTVLTNLRAMMSENKVFRTYLGQGYNNCVTPPVIQRNILENPGWYTAYTPYQAEIAQGRLEALINFQTMIVDLTGMEISNASLLDEGTAAAEAMTLCLRVNESGDRKKFFVSSLTHDHVLELIESRAEPLGIEVVVGDHRQADLDESFFGALLQYPATDGTVFDYKDFCAYAHQRGVLVVVSADLLSLLLLKPPGEWGADVVVGNTQRFGVPLGFGGPHAAYMSTKDQFKRELPGRLIGVSKESGGEPAYRLSLQTREQHIRRDRATSNICTAQVLLAVIASMYAVYHGPRGLRRIAQRVHQGAVDLASALKLNGCEIISAAFFDTITLRAPAALSLIKERAEKQQINLRYFPDGRIGVALDETTTERDLQDIFAAITGKTAAVARSAATAVPEGLRRTSAVLSHPVFSAYQSETELLRYLRRLESKDLSLTTSMIALGSCTMKLNAAVEMYPVTWPEVGQLHPLVPLDQARGYTKFFRDLESMLAEITALPGVSLQPNAGSQGEYTGLLVIRAYHQSRGDLARNICLIPTSAHGTNPASAVMVGMKVVTVACDKEGNVDLTDLRAKAEEHSKQLAAVMITYPSTHGVFEEAVKEICSVIHQHGGQVYMDGANMNAQVGLCRPGEIGADVVHINLHKTFCIPHGGGGPGMGPICVGAHLTEFLPSHGHLEAAGQKRGKRVRAVSSAPWGSASILPISWVYMKLMGPEGLALATKVAILNANYVAKLLEPHYPILYRGENGFNAHECILDMSAFKRTAGIEEVDIAKRLMDYGFHAPTVSFPVVGTLMIEPTESESRAELDRFCQAMIAIRGEIREIEEGKADKLNNLLKHAPHTALKVMSDQWELPYSRERAAYPLPYLKEHKFWPSVGRIDNAFGGSKPFCTCVPVS